MSDPREIFNLDARRRAGRLMAERGRVTRRGNGYGSTLLLDPDKLARFEPARERLAGQIVDGMLP
ncbi:MAG: hypothetical protein ACRDYV_23295, partial [Acidimicrobiia bacterium]